MQRGYVICSGSQDPQSSRDKMCYPRRSGLIILYSDDYNDVSQTSVILSDFYHNCVRLHDYLLCILH